MIKSIKLPYNIKPINKTGVNPDEKPQILNNLNKYVKSYVREKILELNLYNNESEKTKFIEQCKIACKLAVKVIQEGKNHKGTVTFENLYYYGELNNVEAINLLNLLVGKPNPEENEEGSPADNLDKLCKHSNTVIPNRKLSFWGTSYTNHAEKFRQFIDHALDNAVSKRPHILIRNLDTWVTEAPDGEREARLTAKSRILEAYRENFNELNLSGLSLTTLPIGVLNSLTKRTEMNLSRNKLSKLPDGVFDGLTKLTEMNLSRNKLCKLPDGVFNGLTKLQNLDLSYNQLSKL
ncbi:MAG: leucine-rich repeat domain-containing protein, partial [Burkholderiales bacterium]